MLPARCRQLQAGSLRSPDSVASLFGERFFLKVSITRRDRQHSRRVRYPEVRFPYSVRSADIGVIRVARLAGSHVAINVAAAMNSGAVVKATRSSDPT
jgi:hypothetical protein